MRFILIILIAFNLSLADDFAFQGKVNSNLEEMTGGDEGQIHIYLKSYSLNEKYNDIADTYTYGGWRSNPLPSHWEGYIYAMGEGFVMEPDTHHNMSIHSEYQHVDFIATDTMKPEVYIREPFSGPLYLNETDTIHTTMADNSYELSRLIYSITYDGINWENVYDIDHKGNNDTYIYAYDTSRHPCKAYKDFIPYKTTTTFRTRAIAIDQYDNSDTAYSPILSVIDTIKPDITISAPIDEEIWVTNIPHDIKWTASDNDTIVSRSIYFSTDSGQNYTFIDSANNNTGIYQYTPSIISKQCKIKIYVYDKYTSSFAESPIFNIIDTTKPNINLISPNGGESWLKGSTHTIKWEASDNIGLSNLAINISYNDKTKWNLIENIPYDTNYYSWTIPDSIHENCFINVTVTDSSGNKSSDTSDISFSIIPPAPNAPVLIYPSDNFVGVPIKIAFKWNQVPGALKYRICISSDNFDTYFRNQIVHDTAFGLFTSFHGLEYKTNYKWKVQAKNTGGDGPWSEACFKTIDPPPDMITIISPLENELVSTSPTLLWHKNPNAKSYEIRVRKSDTTIYSFYRIIPDTSYTLSNLDDSTSYTWFVCGKNDAGLGICTKRNFKTISVPDSVIILFPEDGQFIKDDNIVLKWNNVEYADSFHVIISKHPDSVIIDTLLVDTMLKLKNLNNALYDIDISAKNEVGQGPVNKIQFVVNRTVTSILPKKISLNILKTSLRKDIMIGLPSESNVLIEIFNMRGRQNIKIIKRLSAGYHQINIGDINAGYYIMNIKIKDYHKKLIIPLGL